METWALGLARGLSLLGASGLFGLVLFEGVLAGRPGPAAAHPAGSAGGRNRAGTALLGLSLLVLAAGLLWLLVQLQVLGTALLGPVSQALITTAGFGRQWLLRQGLAGAAVLAVTLGLRASPGAAAGAEQWGQGRWGLAVVVAASLLMAHVLSGHAVADVAPVLPVVADSLHLLAAGVWFGGLLGLSTALRVGAPEDVARRFSRLAAAAVAVLIASGLIQAVLRIAGVAGLRATPYGQVLLFKLSALAAALILAARNQFDVRAGRNGIVLARRVAWESAFVGAVVTLGGVMASLPPGQLGQLFTKQEQTVSTPDGPWKLELWPAGPGRVFLRVYPPRERFSGAPRPARPRGRGPEETEFRARFVMQDMTMPARGFALRSDGAGGLEGGGPVLTMPGTWEVRVYRLAPGGPKVWTRATFQAEPQREKQPPQGLKGLGFTWERVLRADVFDLYADPSGGLWAAGRDGLRFSSDGRTWSEMSGLPAPVYAVARVGGRLVAATARGLYEQREPSVAGESGWVRVNLPDQEGAVFGLAGGDATGYALDPGALYRFRPGPAGWHVERQVVPDHPEPDPISRLFADPRDPQHLWVPRHESFQETPDGGRTFHRIRPAAGGVELLDIQAVLRNPYRPGEVWMAAMVGGIAVSPDGGRTWQLRNAGLPETAMMALAPGNVPGSWYAGTMYHGVAFTDDDGRTWRSIGLTNASVRDVAVLREGAVLVATQGMGLFRGLPEPPQAGPRPLGPVAAVVWAGAWGAAVFPVFRGVRRRWGPGWAGLWAVLAVASAAILPLAVRMR
ncbi:CopD family protein [Caldinitratiruptor microaerophilus]|uniref:Copper resistance protein D domain-containing protein n=1 Tax=Caldinitratiruptor microaerophilus TaxID=671077 RepID=A0AA35CKW6_9FIRM|nr:CopD family protein [Caldinitratiruptor microaerophilus]BDG61185.1 hypothetical protein caldi_22750 [Caldinitratiruptor microaerophilus]